MRPIQISFCTVLIKSTQLPEVPKKDHTEKFPKGDNKWIKGMPTSGRSCR